MYVPVSSCIVNCADHVIIQIINKVKSTVDADASACIILEGYSQGAAATVNAMPKITDKYMEAVKGVVMVGDPEHKSGLACNVDNNGGDSTKDVNGLEVALGSIPDTWISKTLDICIYVRTLWDLVRIF